MEVSNLSQRSTLVRTGTWSLNIGSTFTNQKRKGTNFEGCRLIDAGGSTTRHSCPEERGFCTQIHLAELIAVGHHMIKRLVTYGNL